MKKIILFSFLLNLNLFASDEHYTLKLYERIIPILLSTSNIFVYADKKSKLILKDSKIFKIVKECKNADIVMGNRFSTDNRCVNKKPLFATSYRSYKKYKNAFGAFYWRKGRPQIKLNKINIGKYEYKLTSSLLRYAK